MNTFFSCKKLLLTVFSIIGLTLLSGCGGGGGSTPTAVTLVSIAVTPSAVTIEHGETVYLRAVGTYTDGSTADLTTQVTWTSAAPSMATAGSHTGSVTGTAIGTTTITAALSGITSNTANINVIAATLSSIAITPASVSLVKGTNTSLSAIGTYSDGSSSDISTQVAWTSASPATATLGLHTGAVTGVAVGSTTVSASLNGISSPNANITVTDAILSSIAITGATLPKGTTANLVATGTYSDGTTAIITADVSWTSADPSTATVGVHTGAVVGTEVGITTVTAALSGITSNTADIDVIAATLSSIAITPAPVSLAKGTNTNLSATGTYSDGDTRDITTQVNWTSLAPATASVGASTGVVQANAVGSTSISASLNGIDAPSINVTVTPAVLTGIAITPSPVSIAKGASTNLTATGTYSDGTTQDITTEANWTSAAPATATAGLNTGIVTGVAEGSTTVYAASGGVNSPAVSITVTPTIYATWNPAGAPADFAFSSDKLTATSPDLYTSCRATIGISSGTAFWEVVVTPGTFDSMVGIAMLSSDLADYVGSGPGDWGMYTSNRSIVNNGAWVSYGSPIPGNPVPAGAVIGFGLNMSAGTLRIWINGVDQGVAVSGLAGKTIYPATSGFDAGITANFGATPFVYPQTGYSAGVYQH